MAKKDDCIFCRIASGEIKSRKLYEDDNFIVIPDANPVSEGHCLIIPRKHYPTILDLPPSLGTEFISLAKKQGLRLIKEGKASGFNLVQNNFSSAGQVVKHVHFHIIPRKDKDGLKI